MKSLSDPQAKQFHYITGSDPLYTLTPDDRQLLWSMRHHLVKFPSLLPKFLQSVNWGIQDFKFEAHRLLSIWYIYISTYTHIIIIVLLLIVLVSFAVILHLDL